MTLIKKYLLLGAILSIGSATASEAVAESEFHTETQSEQVCEAVKSEVEQACVTSTESESCKNAQDEAVESMQEVSQIADHKIVEPILDIASKLNTELAQMDKANLAAESKQFEKLLKRALSAEAPSSESMLNRVLIRNALKVVPTALIFTLLGIVGKKNTIKNYVDYNFALNYLAPICDNFLYRSDESLAALKKLEEYVSDLSPAQKKEVTALFHSYKSLLNEKIMRENDAYNSRKGKNFEVGFDLALPIITIIAYVSIARYNDVDSLPEKTFFIGVLPAILDYIALAIRTYNSAESQKKLTLQNIEDALD